MDKDKNLEKIAGTFFAVYDRPAAETSYLSPGEDVLGGGAGLKGSSRAPEPEANTETPVREEL